MHLIAIYGSPRKNGNSDKILNAVLKGIIEKKITGSRIDCKKIFVRNLNIQPCKGCRKCDNTGRCVISNDDMNWIYKKIETCDRIIVSAPLYFCGLPAQLKALVDRSQCYWARKYLLSSMFNVQCSKLAKLGVFICVGATKSKRLFAGVKQTIKYFFDVYNIKYFADFIATCIDKKGAAVQNKALLEKAFQFGIKFAKIKP